MRKYRKRLPFAPLRMRKASIIVLSALMLTMLAKPSNAAQTVTLSLSGQTILEAPSFSDASESLKSKSGGTLGNFEKGDWAEYKIQTLKTGLYRFVLYMESQYTVNGAFEALLNSSQVQSAQFDVNKTSGFEEAASFQINMFEGLNTVKIRALAPIQASLEKISIESMNLTGTFISLASNTIGRIEYGDPVTFTCTVQTDGKPATGIVAFSIDGLKLDPIELNVQGSATYSNTGLASGKHAIAATYEFNGMTYQSNALSFTVYKTTALSIEGVSGIETLYAEYGQKLSEISLKPGYRWQEPDHYVGNASGKPNTFICLYNTDPKNFEDLPIEANVLVSQRKIILKAADKHKTLGETDPNLTIVVVKGAILQGDTIEGSLKYTGSKVGRYDITEAKTLKNPNYNIEFLKGTMEILPTNAMSELHNNVYELTAVKSLQEADKLAKIYNDFRSLKPWEQECLSESDSNYLNALQLQAKAANQSSNSCFIPDNSLPWNIRAEIVEKDELGSSVTSTAKNSDIRVFEIVLTNTLNGQLYIPSSAKPVSIVIKSKSLNMGNEVILAHERSDGTVEYVNSKLSDGNISFQSYGSSIFAIATSMDAFKKVSVETLLSTSRSKVRWLPVFALVMVATIYFATTKIERSRLYPQPKRATNEAMHTISFKPSKYVYKYLKKT